MLPGELAASRRPGPAMTARLAALLAVVGGVLGAGPAAAAIEDLAVTRGTSARRGRWRCPRTRRRGPG
jgi:hypothetical protein